MKVCDGDEEKFAENVDYFESGTSFWGFRELLARTVKNDEESKAQIFSPKSKFYMRLCFRPQKLPMFVDGKPILFPILFV